MLERVLHAPISWFDATPMGRIFNRFSHDLQVMMIMMTMMMMTMSRVGVSLSLVTAEVTVMSLEVRAGGTGVRHLESVGVSGRRGLTSVSVRARGTAV
jgi:hypothetical protein